MKLFRTCICILLALTLTISGLAFSASALNVPQTHYIDVLNGNDANDGLTPETAVKSVNGLKINEVIPGTKFLFRNGGVYDCNVVIGEWQGTKENPVVISSYGEGETAILKTDLHTEVFQLIDCSYVTISDLSITAPNGGGIWIDTLNKTSEGIILENLYFYDMQNHTVNSRDDFSRGAAAARAAVMIKGLPARSRYAVNDLTVTGCEVYNCGNGVIIWGSWNDQQQPWCETEEEIDPVYNTGVLVEHCYFHDMDAEAVVVGMCDGALVTHCRAINCCQGLGVDENGEILYFTAAMWFWGSENSTIQYCEIAGQKNVGDGMAVDFDSHSNNCTYQYIYSHDNTRFMCNCPNYSGQHNNTVRFCLSVNDNGGRSACAGGSGEYGFSFYNNTIINCGEFQFFNIYDSYIANNIIVPADGQVVSYRLNELLTAGNTFTNNCYYNVFTPLFDPTAMNTVPGFTAADVTDYNSFTLSADSPLIGAGAAVKGTEAMTDFFGNPIESNNIGCYSGTGTDSEYIPEGAVNKVIRMISHIFEILIHEIMNLLEDI